MARLSDGPGHSRTLRGSDQSFRANSRYSAGISVPNRWPTCI